LAHFPFETKEQGELGLHCADVSQPAQDLRHELEDRCYEKVLIAMENMAYL
jgi:hypothetical protein